MCELAIRLGWAGALYQGELDAVLSCPGPNVKPIAFQLFLLAL